MGFSQHALIQSQTGSVEGVGSHGCHKIVFENSCCVDTGRSDENHKSQFNSCHTQVQGVTRAPRLHSSASNTLPIVSVLWEAIVSDRPFNIPPLLEQTTSF